LVNTYLYPSLSLSLSLSLPNIKMCEKMNFEKHYDDYLKLNQEYDLHPDLQTSCQNPLKNTIFYGPSGVGKYTQSLKKMKQYSPSELKYEKRISVIYNKQPYFFKISDIHYEIDMSLLGCNSKLVWHEIYQQIIDILTTKTKKTGIILCKNFHDIHNELLDNFYNYMTNIVQNEIKIVYYILTEQVSFIPNNIIQCSQIISIARPSKKQYNTCILNNLKHYSIGINEFSRDFLDKVKVENITNIKQLYNETLNDTEQEEQYKAICNKIINLIYEPGKTFNFLKFRDLLYELLIYHLNIFECVWYILSSLIKKDFISNDKFDEVIIRTYTFFQYFNNNYRPIYHLENYFLFLIKKGNDGTMS